MTYRLSASTQRTYSYTVRPFIAFLASEHIPTAAITNATVARYVAWLWSHPTYSLSPDTLRSYVSAARSTFGPLTRTPLDSHDPLVTDLLTSYTNHYAIAHPPKPQQAAWPAAATVACSNMIAAWLQHPNSTADRTIDSAALVLFAMLVFCRGFTNDAARRVMPRLGPGLPHHPRQGHPHGGFPTPAPRRLVFPLHPHRLHLGSFPHRCPHRVHRTLCGPCPDVNNTWLHSVRCARRRRRPTTVPQPTTTCPATILMKSSLVILGFGQQR